MPAKRPELIRTLFGASLCILICSPSVVLAQVTIDGGQIVTVPGSQTSPWNVGGNLTIGLSGVGELNISGGGIVSNAFGTIGGNSGSSGSVTVTGSGSQWNNSNNLRFGLDGGAGELTVSSGGVVTSGGGFIGVATGSSGSVTVKDAGSQWNLAALYVGYLGTGEVTISNGGVISNTSYASYVGYSAGSSGVMTVTGAGSQWNTANVTVGNNGGTGILTISNGGAVSNSTARAIGSGTNSSGSVTVEGAGSQWSIAGILYVGNSGGAGSLTISDGAMVSNTPAFVGYQNGSGSVVVTGAGSQWNNVGTSQAFVIGHNGSTGELIIADGAVVTNASIGRIGYSTNSLQPGSGSVTVTGQDSQWRNDRALYLGGDIATASGILTVADEGLVTAANVEIAFGATSDGTLVIGAHAGQAAIAPGTVETDYIRFGSGTGRIVFNHTSNRYIFDATINGGADNAAGSGTGLVGTGLVEAVSGRTVFNADHGDFTGTLQAGGHGILQINGDMSHGTVSILVGGILEGNGFVGNTVNAGIVAPGGSIGTLTVAGDYTGNGGALHIETVLGNDASPADRLVITGDVSGTTSVTVFNRGGLGAQTANGIRIIDIGGVSPSNAFTLAGDYITADGRQAVIGGAYAYTLRHNSETNPDGNWYLTSEMILVDPETGQPEEGPRYQPGVVVFEQYPQVLAALNTVPTLQQRVGNRYWPGQAATGQPARTYGMWGHIEGSRTLSEPDRSTSGSRRDIDLWKLQTGFDFALHQGRDGSLLIAGVNVSYGTASAEMSSLIGRGKIDTTGTGIGATLTWYGSNGFYVDGQAQAMWFDSDLTSTTEGRRLVSGNDGHGYAFSVETGRRYEFGSGISVTPQVQLVYAKVDFDSFHDPFSTRVSLQDGDSLKARLGVSLDRQASWVATDGTNSRSHLYGIVNLTNEFLDGSKVDVSGVRFRTRDERLWAGIGAGGTYEWSNGQYAFYGNVNLASSTRNFGDSYALNGILGFRANW